MSVTIFGKVPISIQPESSPTAGQWRWSKLTNLAKLESGHTPSRDRKDWWGGDVSWLSLTEIRAFDGKWVEETKLRTNEAGIANSSARILPKGTVCLSRTASVGFVAIMGKPMATSQDFANWVCGDNLDPEFLMYALLASREMFRRIAVGAIHKTIYMPVLKNFHVYHPPIRIQRQIASELNRRLAAASNIEEGARRQLEDAKMLGHSIISQSVTSGSSSVLDIGQALEEVTHGIGASWKDHRVLGATRDGLAPAKERPGKHAERYKPVAAGTVFYNPMRILIGSIAFVDDDEEPGITSPDYVVLKGKPGVVDSRWFYYWLRSPLGERCIQSLARGAVRERMLFSRLAEGEIELPDYKVQVKASKALAQIKPMRAAIQKQIEEIELLPRKLLAQVFDS
jgi:type I restriction enzyme S subunit